MSCAAPTTSRSPGPTRPEAPPGTESPHRFPGPRASMISRKKSHARNLSHRPTRHPESDLRLNPLECRPSHQRGHNPRKLLKTGDLPRAAVVEGLAEAQRVV